MCLFTILVLSENKCYCIAGNHKKISKLPPQIVRTDFHYMMTQLQKVHIC